MILTEDTNPKAVLYIGEVNQLAGMLIEIDDFDMTFSDSENTINSVITDEDNDRATIFLNGETICEYVYGGINFYPVFVDTKLLKEGIEILKEHLNISKKIKG